MKRADCNGWLLETATDGQTWFAWVSNPARVPLGYHKSTTEYVAVFGACVEAARKTLYAPSRVNDLWDAYMLATGHYVPAREV
jgi:hypothetical protein